MSLKEVLIKVDGGGHKFLLIGQPTARPTATSKPAAPLSTLAVSAKELSLKVAEINFAVQTGEKPVFANLMGGDFNSGHSGRRISARLGTLDQS